MISNRYLKVMFKITKTGHLPSPGRFIPRNGMSTGIPTDSNLFGGASRPPLGRPQYDSTVEIEVDRWRGASRCGLPGHPFDGWIGRPEEKMSKHVETCRNMPKLEWETNHHEWSSKIDTSPSWTAPDDPGSEHQRRRTTLIFGQGMSRVLRGYEHDIPHGVRIRHGCDGSQTAMIPLGSWDELPICQAPVHCHLQPPLLDKCCGAGVDLQLLTWHCIMAWRKLLHDCHWSGRPSTSIVNARS